MEKWQTKVLQKKTFKIRGNKQCPIVKGEAADGSDTAARCPYSDQVWDLSVRHLRGFGGSWGGSSSLKLLRKTIEQHPR